MRRSDNHKFSNLGHWHHGGIGRIAPAPDGGRGRALLKAVLATGVAAAMLHATHAGGVPADPLRMADLTPVTVHPAPQHAPVALARDGRPVAVVYVAEPAPSAALQRMLDELITVVRLTTGATLERVAEPPSDEQPALILGDSQASRLAGIAADAIPVEGFVVKTAPNRIFLVGSTRALPAMDPRSLGGTPYANDGTAWAVADFLERFVGVRWYWPIDTGGRSIIAQPSLAVPPVHYEDRPVFRRRDFFPRHGYRENDWRALWWDRTSPSLPASLLPPDTELLSMQPLLTALRSGNSWPYLIKVHEPQHFRRQADRYTNRPELFQKNADGSPDLRMLCYSSQAAFDYIVAGCERAWDHGEPVSWVTATCVTVSPGDYVVRCHCPDCLALFEPGRAPYGTASRVMSRFVKRLCEEVAQRWPGRKVIYLPYWNYTECVDDIAFPGNLEIEMCTMAFGLMRQPGPRARMEKHLRAWSEKVGGRITTWEYSHRLHEWTYAPVQYPHLIRDYYQANRDILAGSFLNGGKIGEWSTGAPGNYVWFKVLWNPDLDVDAVLDEWCRRLFGAAGGTCRELLRLMCERWQEAPWSTGLGDNGRVTAPILADTYPPAVVARMVALRDRARREMAGDALVEKRFAYWTWTFDPFLVEVKRAWTEVGIAEAPPLPAAGGDIESGKDGKP